MVDADASVNGALRLVGLEPLMARTGGRGDVGIALLDGPVAAAHPDLLEATIVPLQAAACSWPDSSACAHGTFVAGILAARRDSAAPAICPGCTLLVRPIFDELAGDGRVPASDPDLVAQALVDAAAAGARIVNLSAATAQPTTRVERALTAALDYVAARGVLVIAAAGNQGTLGSSAITRHAGVIPVVACDRVGRPMRDSNLGASAGRRGLAAPGDGIISLAPAGGTTTASGTSFATAFVSGAAALLWSLFPELDASMIREALLHDRARRSVVPPVLEAQTALAIMTARYGGEGRPRAHRSVGRSTFTTGRNRSVTVAEMAEVAEEHVSEQPAEPVAANNDAPVTRYVEPGALTDPPRSAPVAAPAPPAPSFVYAIGRVDWRFPSLGVEKEFAQATASPGSAGRTDHEVQSTALARPELKYLVRQLCWVFVIGGLETYILTPRDPEDFNLLAASVRASYSADDLDAVIGIRGPVAPPEMCNGLALPIVVFDQLYSFDRHTLITSIPLPSEGEAIDEPHFRSSAGDLFNKIIELADNAGSTDEYRALNYLAVRYPRIYTVATVMHDNNYAFSGVEVRRAPLTSARTVLDVIFSFTHRTTDVTDKQFVRVDATEEWPFIVKKIGPYFEI